MPQTFDVVVVGGGLVGASTAFHLADRSDRTVALVERGKICSGGTASSCAIVRTHYSVPGNVALTVESLRIFDDFPGYLDDSEAESGFVRSGYLILAPEGQTSDKLVANMRMQREFAETRAISHADALELHPLLSLTGIDAVGYEPDSGYADPYLTTTGFERAARRRGVTVMTDQPVERLLADGMRVTGVETRQGAIHAGCVVCAIGPWTRTLTDPLGIETHLEVSRHTVLTLGSGAPYGLAPKAGVPGVLLRGGLDDPCVPVRRAAAIALGRRGDAGAKEALIAELAVDPSRAVIEALAAIGDDGAIVHLGRCAERHPALFGAVVDALRDMESARAERLAGRLEGG